MNCCLSLILNLKEMTNALQPECKLYNDNWGGSTSSPGRKENIYDNIHPPDLRTLLTAKNSENICICLMNITPDTKYTITV